MFGTPYADWKNLFASGTPLYPAHIAAQLGLAHEFIDIDNPA